MQDVTDFGAVGDGSTDDTQAIRAAADAAGVGGTVYFPPGTYLVGSDTRLPLQYPDDGSWDDLTWSGESYDTTTLMMAGGQTQAHFIFLVEATQAPDSVTFKNLTLDGQKSAQSSDSVGLCIQTDGVGTLTMRDCWLKNSQNGTLKLNGEMDADIRYSRFSNAGYISNGGHAVAANQTTQATTTLRRCLLHDQKGADVDVGKERDPTVQTIDEQTVLIEECIMRDSYRGSLKVNQSNATTTVRNSLLEGNADTEIPIKSNPHDYSVGTIRVESSIIDGGKFPAVDLPVSGSLELADVAIKNVGTGGHRDGAGLYSNGVAISGTQVSIHGTDTQVYFSDGASGSISEVIHEGQPLGTDPAGIVAATTVGDPLTPPVPAESSVGPGALNSTDSGSGSDSDSDTDTDSGSSLPDAGSPTNGTARRPSSFDNVSFGNTSFDGAITESEPRIKFDVPWVIDGIRVEGITADVDLGNVVPGESVTYRVAFLPGAESEHDEIADHVTRYKALRKFRQNSRAVVTDRRISGECYWMEQHGGASQLVRIQPLQAGSPGTTPDGSEPPGRASLWEGRWAVIDGPGADVTTPVETDHRGPCVLEIKTTTIARTSEFPTARALRAARDKSGY